MLQFWPTGLARLRRRLALVLTGPPAFAFIPAMCLAAFWFGGEGALVVLAGLLPLLYLLSDTFHGRPASVGDLSTSILSRSAFEELAEQIYFRAQEKGRHSVAFFLVIEDFEQIIERFGQATADIVCNRVSERLLATVRGDDRVGQMGDARFAICAEPVRHLDLELCIQMAGRLQSVVEEPVSVEGTGVYISVSVGFCQLSRAPGKSGSDWINAAATALREAQKRGPSAIRAFSTRMQQASLARAELREDVMRALENGEIQPWFQPQISTETGHISGFEALARWQHPERGMISPAEFLPAVEQAGQLERLAEVIMYHSFAALKAWDGAGVDVPQVGVNFAGSELNNPKLLDKIKWELDRFDLTPNRLAVEVLETVVAAGPDDMITRNINALGKLGCRVDLDDFGTGHASIASIRNFSVSRIKIDRSFVMKADRDADQQRMISAILTMAERLGVETLAEGVETVGEHVLLAQLGCDHVQGFGIGRPMPFEKTLDWIDRHNTKLENVPQIMNDKGT
ncbi:bifunctional diguanylate cyclase/phosphodiesterase [Sulfitobacter sp. F26204]|uniref:putative bifunctional diguanylate cyclase/phosphodiesterase n=1 Tax=Sulfitobacter sp. F26204 TaxID=2996014 RepID=UPI00225DD712|nr:bifunctional diguanylate cyclase/phosphodiesterase [Sulfitobacter sp. F26204]MCX7558727.1 bifunctional diguanylate cyclase/phosphodiesterase [Sulfitobacter sp. F26204]